MWAYDCIEVAEQAMKERWEESLGDAAGTQQVAGDYVQVAA
jgi:hypothetical protein